MIHAKIMQEGKELLSVKFEYEFPPGKTKSDIILAAMSNPYEIHVSGGDLKLVQDTGAFVSLVLSLMNKEPQCVFLNT